MPSPGRRQTWLADETGGETAGAGDFDATIKTVVTASTPNVFRGTAGESKCKTTRKEARNGMQITEYRVPQTAVG